MSWESYRNLVLEKLKVKLSTEQNKILNSTARTKLIAGGWRGGKSFIGSLEGTLHAVHSNLIWLVGMTYDRMRDYEFSYMEENLGKLDLISKNGISKPRHGACDIELINGCKIVTKSADDPQGLGGAAPDFVLGCEAGQFPYDVYLWLRGRIAEKRANLTLTGTFEGAASWYHDYFKMWESPNEDDAQSFSLPAWSNLIVYPGGWDDTEIQKQKRELPVDVFNEKLGGRPGTPSNAILPEFTHKVHVGEYPFDPNLPVEICVDPGYRHPGAYAVGAIQYKEGQLILIDEIYLAGYTNEDMVLMLQQKPWGAAVQRGVIDVAGRAHQASRSPIEVWREDGQINLDSRKVEEEGGINTLRTWLKVNPLTNKPKILINHTCHGFIAECGGGKSPVNGGGMWLRDPNTHKPIDANNHITKAMAYFLVNRYGYTANRPKRKIVRIM